jgi:hypothetical protein
MNHLEDLELKFSAIEAKLVSLNEAVLRDVSPADFHKISRFYDHELRFQAIDSKRMGLLNDVDSIFTKFIGDLNKEKPITTLKFANVLHDPLKLKKQLVSYLELRKRIKYFKYTASDLETFSSQS